MNLLQKLYWRKLSKPAGDRPLWSFLIDTPITSVLQIGLGDGTQTRTLLQLVQNADPEYVIRFAGIDPFESALQSGHMRLKDAHRMCAEAGVKTHLIPGDLRAALPRAAVTILPSDLVVINPTVENGSNDEVALQTWLPRLMHPKSTVLQRNANGQLQTVHIASACQVRQAA